KPAGNRRPASMQCTEHRVAIANRINEHPNAEQVIDFVKFFILLLHFLVDRIIVFRPTSDRRTNFDGPKFLIYLFGKISDNLLALGGSLPHQPNNFGIYLWPQSSEGKIF